MLFTGIWKRRIALLLVLALLAAPVAQVSAEELPEDTKLLQEQDETEGSEVPEGSEEPGEPKETEAPEESEEPEASEEPEQAAQRSSASAVSIAEVLKMEPGGEALTITGTVVFTVSTQAVLQDETGGIRMSFASPPELAPGDILRVTGYRSGGFAVEAFEKTGAGPLPAVESKLQANQSNVRLLVKEAVLGRRSLSQDGYTCQMVGTVPDGLETGDLVDAWGVLLDGIFYADTITRAESREQEVSLDSNWNFYFGQLHAHTNLSDGTGSVEEAFAYAREVQDLDFFAVTDHSNSFDNADLGAITEDGTAISQEWAAGRAAASAVTDENFVGIFGYEMTWPEDLSIGHINTFGTPGWQTRDQEGMNTLKGYLDTLAAAPDSVSQFNHPGLFYGDFRNFSEYDPRYDARVHLLEVGGEGSFTAYDAYTTALDAGWHLAPSTSENNHNGNWGRESTDRTVVLARELTEEAIFDAIRNHRVYATEDADLKIAYRLNGRIMGSVMEEANTLRADIRLEDGSGDPIGRVEVVTEGGDVAAAAEVTEASGEYSLEVPGGGSYYYLRILRNGKITAVTAPVWVDAYEDLGIASFTADVEKPEQGKPAALTLTLYNQEDLPFVVDSVTFSVGADVIGTVTAPGSVAPMEELEIPLSYAQATAGAVTITAAVSGTIGSLSWSFREDLTLHYQPTETELVSVEALRGGVPGTAYRIRGYVTAGTSKSCNAFPGSIYLQDDSGGIEIRDFTQEGIQVGTPMEIEGILRSSGGNLVLAMTDCWILEEDYYRYAPKTMAHGFAMDYAARGGQLLQIEGQVVSVTETPDQKGVSRFTMQDIVGDLATVVVEDGIGSGAYGTNTLASEVKTGRTIRAMGLLHIDEYGQTVLRVRNCDEVAYVLPMKDPTNPKTGDWLAMFRKET